MKKILLIFNIVVLNSFALETPPKAKSKRALTFSEESEQESNIQFLTPTSPAKPAFLSPEKPPVEKKMRAQEADYPPTETFTEVERKVAKIPTLLSVQNNFSFPVLVSYPFLPHYQLKLVELYPGDKADLNGLRLEVPQLAVTIAANNRIHKIQYGVHPYKEFVHTINKGVIGELKIGTKKAIIEVDTNGDVQIKSFSE